MVMLIIGLLLLLVCGVGLLIAFYLRDGGLSRNKDDNNSEEILRLREELEQMKKEYRLQSEAALRSIAENKGEIHGLYSGMEDIRRVFANVKTRGVWGEAQLSRILEEVLPSSCYQENSAVGSDPRDRVEFAVILPGKTEGQNVYLPIDSKFPTEDYMRLVEAEAAGDEDTAEQCRRALERNLKNEAKKISEKYINPPKTTEYALMFLPTEGLYNAATELVSFMAYAEQQRIMVTGPSNLAAFLNILNMGFKTLAVEAKTGEIRDLLQSVTVDMEKFEDSLEKTGRKLNEAETALREAVHRTEIIRRKLKKLEIQDD